MALASERSAPGSLGPVPRRRALPLCLSGVVLPAMRWIWIDKFIEFRSGQFARAIKNLTLAEEHLHDHFPGYPVMPASLIIEGLAQTGGILVGEAGGFAEKVVLAKIPRAEFYGVACAGDQLIYEVTLTDLRSEGAASPARRSWTASCWRMPRSSSPTWTIPAPTKSSAPRTLCSLSSFSGVLDLAKAQQRARERRHCGRRNGSSEWTAPR